MYFAVFLGLRCRGDFRSHDIYTLDLELAAFRLIIVETTGREGRVRDV